MKPTDNASDFTTLANTLTWRAQMAADRREAVAMQDIKSYYVATMPKEAKMHGKHKPYTLDWGQ